MIEPPTNCPSCDSLLEWANDLLYCRNANCGSTNSKKVAHFATSMKIMGLGPSTIDKLGLSNIYEIYGLDKSDIIELLASEKLGSKLYDEIKQSINKPLNLVLPALGIPLIGNTATEKLSKVCQSIFDIDENSCKAAGLGPKATQSLLDWLDNNIDEIANLPFSFEFVKKSTGSRGVICISGKLISYPTKQDAQRDLENMGFVVKTSLTKDVTILINERGRETSKTDQARKSGITIVTNLKTFIGDLNK